MWVVREEVQVAWEKLIIVLYDIRILCCFDSQWSSFVCFVMWSMFVFLLRWKHWWSHTDGHTLVVTHWWSHRCITFEKMDSSSFRNLEFTINITYAMILLYSFFKHLKQSSLPLWYLQPLLFTLYHDDFWHLQINVQGFEYLNLLRGYRGQLERS